MFLDRGEQRFLPSPASQQLSVLHFPFIISSILIFISAGAPTLRSHPSIAKYKIESCLSCEVVHCDFKHKQTHLFAIAAMH